MSFNTNRFTQKSYEAIAAAQAAAERLGNSEVQPEHLLYALLDQSDGVVPQVLSKLNIPVGALKQQVNNEISRFPASAVVVCRYNSVRDCGQFW